MAHYRPLRNAPVREALIDIQFESPVDLSLVDQFAVAVAVSYEKKGDIWEARFGFNTEGTPAASAAHSSIGRRLEAKGGRPYVVQCRSSGFTVSRLSPYGHWDELLSETRQLWSQFVAFAGELTISRVGVRYINEIKLPLPIASFGDYFVCPPKVPEPLPQEIAGFITRVIIPDPQRNCISVVTQALEGPQTTEASGNFITVLLDIDVFRTGRLPDCDNSLWETLGVLRDQKNRMFFEHLTERTVEKYE